MILTIQDYLSQNPSSPFLGAVIVPAGIVTEDFQKTLTGYIANNYYDYRLLDSIIAAATFSNTDTDIAIQTIIRGKCDFVYLAHQYTYQTLFDSMKFKYNPIENYNMLETEKTTNSGNDVTTKDIGSHTESETDDGRTITDSYAKDTMTGDTKDDKAPFNSSTYQNLDKGHSTQVRDSRTDTHKDSGTVLTRSIGGHHDTDNLQHGHVIDRKLERSGNIGTVTAQDMIQQERDIAMLNLVSIVANDIINTICVKYKGVTY